MRRFVDLFAGIGGFHLALRREGLECVFACEKDRAAAAAYRANFGLAPAGDIAQVPAESVPAHDVLCAGFPCQSFSISGKRGGLGDQRGRLFYEIVRIARHHRPQALILENVKLILRLDGGAVQREIYRCLEGELGYRLAHVALNAGDFGVPQRRERVFFVALRRDLALEFKPPCPAPRGRARFVRDILLPDEETAGLVVQRNDIFLDRPEAKRAEPRPIRVGYVNKGGQGERIYSVHGHAVTQSATGGGPGARTGLYLVNGRVRRLHLDEAKRVMGFAARHRVSAGLAGYKQLGNAVVPGVVGRVFRGIRGGERVT